MVIITTTAIGTTTIAMTATIATTTADCSAPSASNSIPTSRSPPQMMRRVLRRAHDRESPTPCAGAIMDPSVDCQPIVTSPLTTLRIVAGLLAHKRSEEHTSELQSPDHLVCRLLL